MLKKKAPAFSVVLYVCALFIALYAFLTFVDCTVYILDLNATGEFTILGSELDVASFFMSNSLQYAATSLILFALGWLIQSGAQPNKEDEKLKEGEEDGEGLLG